MNQIAGLPKTLAILSTIDRGGLCLAFSYWLMITVAVP